MSHDIRIEEIYPFPPKRVWQAIADSKALEQWLMPNDFKPEVGHTFQFRFKEIPGWRGYVDCEVLEVEEPRTLAFTWLGDDDWTKPTEVRFTLYPDGDGTRLVFEHTGFEDPWGAEVSKMLGEGWQGKIRKDIRRIIEQGQVS